ncbi:DUF221-domain-containing protein [Metschnikowia bicuspidata]|uniref:DUF221-domain-containing protein n=1 Tax=Metschnikowia bicuspidata TaxID=27322 RepID=A0A4P9Z8R9_9ASCO|nr:DUF221-domain-containing protein [Metschnikowia bicuspidata]
MSTSQSSSSVSLLLSALIPSAVIFGLFLLIFLAVRKKQPRVYEPRSSVETVPKDLQMEPSPSGPYQWIVSIVKKPHSWLVLKTGTDAFFYLRFIVMFFILAVFGCVLTWPILFPINIVNGNGFQQLDMLTMGNVRDTTRYIAHALVSCVFYGAIAWAIYHEIIYYTTFRHALQTTPLYDSLISSRTLLLTDLPQQYLEEMELRTLFPAASNVWYSRNHKKLLKKVKKREKLAGKYETALNKVLTKAVNLRKKCIKKNKPVPTPENELNSFLEDGKKRPMHRLKFLIGKKVDTLDYGVDKLGELNREIKEEQAQYSLATQTGSVFLEFPTQLDAQKAYQLVPFNKQIKRAGRFIGLAPDDIIWSNLSCSKTLRTFKKLAASAVLILAIIFWCIPVAAVGVITNINYLIEKFPWLSFLNNLPRPLIGVVTSLLPTVVLSLLMSLIPPFIKKMGKISGCITIPEVEKYCQLWFYAFQVVNSFLVVTLASGAVAAAAQVIDDPSSGPALVSQSIPAASNFFIAFMILYGLTFSSGMLLQLVALILTQFLGRFLDKTPKAKWNRYNKLGEPHFSVLYPNFQFLVLITIIYAIVAPIILGFATIAFVLIFAAILYTFVYVLQPNSFDARGRNYPCALFFTFVGLYIAEVLLAIIFGLALAWPAMAIEIALVVATILIHVYLKHKYVSLFDAVPISAIKVAAGDTTYKYPAVDCGRSEIKQQGKSFWEGCNPLDSKAADKVQVMPKTGAATVEESSFEKTSGAPTKASVQEKDSVNEENATRPGPLQAPGFFQRMFNPRAQKFEYLRSQMPAEYFQYVEYREDYVSTAYTDPAVRADEPHIWIPKDEMGLSDIEKNKALDNEVKCSNDNAVFDEKGRVQFQGPPSYEQAIKL